MQHPPLIHLLTCFLPSLPTREAMCSIRHTRVGPCPCGRRLPDAATVSPRALFGTIKWGCYSDQRLKWEPSYKTWGCGRTQFARSQVCMHGRRLLRCLLRRLLRRIALPLIAPHSYRPHLLFRVLLLLQPDSTRLDSTRLG